MSTGASAGALPASPYADRPALRGVFHLGTAFVAVAGLPLLLLLADSPEAYAGGAVFGASLVLLYGTSAAYHRIRWKPSLRPIIRRLDHSMIFVLIGGTYTPISLAVLSPSWWISVLTAVWGIALGGIAMKVVWPDAPRWLTVLLYVALGWAGLVAAGQLASWFTIGPLLLLVLGGVLYTAGGIIYALQRPNPFPRVFGFHEVFHLFVIAGSTLHYSLIAIYVLPA